MKTNPPSKVFISTSSFAATNPHPLDLLKKKGWQIGLNPYGRKLEPRELLTLAQDADGLIAGTEKIEQETINCFRKLRVISRCGAGLDNVDVKAATRKGIAVLSTPEVPVQAVAELTLAMILGMLRRVTEADSQMRGGRWKPLMGQLLTGKIVGIVGLGRIGRRLAQLLKPFHVKIIAFDHRPHMSFAARHHIEWHDLESLLRQSDIVSLHLSLDATTRGLIGPQELQKMKKTAYLVNTSRGELIDDRALAEALQSGDLQGAALDVFAHEPYGGPLLKCVNAILTCHMGSYAKETRLAMETQAARNLIKAFL
jgi:D-3-phosphoglycerate dehydrogenase